MITMHSFTYKNVLVYTIAKLYRSDTTYLCVIFFLITQSKWKSLFRLELLFASIASFIFLA
jgi:hypothetical protein